MTFREFLNEGRITAKSLIDNIVGTAHSKLQYFSNQNGKDVTFNYVKQINGKWETVLATEEPTHINHKGKAYEIPKGYTTDQLQGK